MYKIIRFYQDSRIPRKTVRFFDTLDEAQEHCSDSETSSSTCQEADNVEHTRQYGNWFDGYQEEPPYAQG